MTKDDEALALLQDCLDDSIEWDVLDQRIRAFLATPAAPAAPAEPVQDLSMEMQQMCSDWGTYWRAPDAHGVNLTHAQAIELLEFALGVEVKIAAPPPPSAEAEDAARYRWLRNSRRNADGLVESDDGPYVRSETGDHWFLDGEVLDAAVDAARRAQEAPR